MSAHRFLHAFDELPEGLIDSPVHKISVNWGLAAQAHQLAEIDGRLHWSGWDAADFKEVQARKDRTLLVATIGFGTPPAWSLRIAGYACVELLPASLEIQRFGVAYPFQRLGVGSALMRRIVECLKPEKRRAIGLCVDENNLPAQLFLQQHGFKCCKVTPAPTEKFIQRDPRAGARLTFIYSCRSPTPRRPVDAAGLSGSECSASVPNRVPSPEDKFDE
jgi:ribosomal protein S18 acetylase RimI-like enzyme